MTQIFLCNIILICDFVSVGFHDKRNWWRWIFKLFVFQKYSIVDDD